MTQIFLTISYPYRGSTANDHHITELAAEKDGERMGSGCSLVPPQWRDVEFAFTGKGTRPELKAWAERELKKRWPEVEWRVTDFAQIP